MCKHQRLVRHRSLGIEDLEGRFLLSGSSLSKGLPLLVPAVQVASEQRVPDSPEDELPSSAASRADDDPPDANDLTAARVVAASSARTVIASGPGLPGGPIVVLRADSDIGTYVAAGLSAASVMHQSPLPVAGSLGGDRPNGILLTEEGTLKWPEPGLSAATRELPFGRSTGDLWAASALPLANRLAAGSEAIAPPRGFGLIGETLPFVRASVEQAFARFLTRIEGLGAGQSGRQESPARWVPWIVLTLVAGTGALALRRLRPADDGVGEEEPILGGRIGRHGLPGVPSPGG
jgi:hypothetical protein